MADLNRLRRVACLVRGRHRFKYPDASYPTCRCGASFDWHAGAWSVGPQKPQLVSVPLGDRDG